MDSGTAGQLIAAKSRLQALAGEPDIPQKHAAEMERIADILHRTWARSVIVGFDEQEREREMNSRIDTLLRSADPACQFDTLPAS